MLVHEKPDPQPRDRGLRSQERIRYCDIGGGGVATPATTFEVACVLGIGPGDDQAPTESPVLKSRKPVLEHDQAPKDRAVIPLSNRMLGYQPLYRAPLLR